MSYYIIKGEAQIKFQEAKEGTLGEDNPTTTCFKNILNEWKCYRGFKPGQAELVCDELHSICKPDNMSINAFANQVYEISQFIPPTPSTS